MGKPHALIINDFDSLTEAKIDKIVHQTLEQLVTKANHSRVPPLILTMTTMGDVSRKRRNVP